MREEKERETGYRLEKMVKEWKKNGGLKSYVLINMGKVLELNKEKREAEWKGGTKL